MEIEKHRRSDQKDELHPFEKQISNNAIALKGKIQEAKEQNNITWKEFNDHCEKVFGNYNLFGLKIYKLKNSPFQNNVREIINVSNYKPNESF